MRIALYANEQDSSPNNQDLDWSALRAVLTFVRRTPCDPCPGKKCPHKFGAAWSPVEIAPCPSVCRNHGKPKYRDCGGGQFHRLNDNVCAIHAAVFDIDHVTTATIEGIAARIDAAGLAAILHSTHSHRPPSDGALRLVMPISRPILPHEWPTFRAAVEDRLQLPADKQTKDLARLFFLPSASESSETIAVAAEGAALDVDAILATVPAPAPGPRAVPYGAIAQPAEDDGEPISFDALKHRLRTLKTKYSHGNADDRERAEILDRILKGEPLAEEGSRDATLNRACSMLVTALHYETPPEAILEILRPSVNLIPGEPPDCGSWFDEAADMIDRARSRRAQNDAAKRDWDEQVRQRLARESALADDPAPEPEKPAEEEAAANDDEPPPVRRYSEEQLEEWAQQQGTTIEGFVNRWIIQRGKSFYVFVGGRYRPPITKDDLPVSLPRDLVRSPCLLVTEDKDGNERPLPVATILDRYATVARNVSASLALQRSFYDARTETFFEAVCPLRAIKPKAHPEIQRWLELLGGDQPDRLLDWVATCMRLDRQACAIYLDGPKSCGKSLLANGLARLWTPGGPSELARVLGGFNDVLTTCPLIFADESLPQQKGITAELRRLIGSTSRNLNRKFLPTCNLDGAVRLIIAGNNDRLLDSGEDLSSNDIEAVAGRFLYIQAPQAAADYLASLGGPPVVGKWITDDLLAEHALHLRETRHVHEGSRFLVEGVAQEFHNNLAIGSGMANSVCEWLVRYLCDPQTARPDSNELRSNLILAGLGEVWVNADALARKEAWEKRVPSVNVPSATKVGRALRNLSTGSERVKIGDKQHKYHRISVTLLIAWAERASVVDTEALKARINSPNDALLKALRARQGEAEGATA